MKSVGNLVKEAAVMEELSLATQSVRTAGHVNKVETGTKVAEALGARTVVAEEAGLASRSVSALEEANASKTLNPELGSAHRA